MSRALLAASALAFAAALVPPSPAHACGGGVTTHRGQSSFELDPNRTVAVHFDGGVERYVFDVKFCGAPDDFGLILPIPSAPSSPPALSSVSFQSLAEETRPILSCSSGGGGGCLPGSAGADGAGALPGDDRGVDVVGTGKVSVFDYVILSAKEVGALEDWLRANDYVFDEKARAIYQSYIDRDWLFVAFKVDTSTLSQPNADDAGSQPPRGDHAADGGSEDAGESDDGDGGMRDAGFDADVDASATDDAGTTPAPAPPSPSVCGRFGPLELTFPSAHLVIPTRILGAASASRQEWTVFTAGAHQFLPSESSAHQARVTYSGPSWGASPAVPSQLYASGDRLTAMTIAVDPTADDLVLDRVSDEDVASSCPVEESSSSCSTGIRASGGQTLGTLLVAAATAIAVRGRKRRPR